MSLRKGSRPHECIKAITRCTEFLQKPWEIGMVEALGVAAEVPGYPGRTEVVTFPHSPQGFKTGLSRYSKSFVLRVTNVMP